MKGACWLVIPCWFCITAITVSLVSHDTTPVIEALVVLAWVLASRTVARGWRILDHVRSLRRSRP